MFDAVSEWFGAEAPSPPLSVSAVLVHLSRVGAVFAGLVAVVAAWRYLAAGIAGVAFVLGGALALAIAVVAGVLGALRWRKAAGALAAVLIVVIAQLGPFVVHLGGTEATVLYGTLGLIVASSLAIVVGYAEVQRLQTPDAGT